MLSWHFSTLPGAAGKRSAARSTNTGNAAKHVPLAEVGMAAD